MADWNPRANELFLRAILAPDPAARAALLDRECRGDADLRRAVEALLAAHMAAGSFLADPYPAAVPPPPRGGDGPDRTADLPPDATADLPPDRTGTYPGGTTTAPLPPPQDVAGAVVAGRYKLREQIGEGGMGTVWVADQTEPVKRRVAVKLVRADRGHSKTILARFEAERQAIALMDHPHIAKLLDAGGWGLSGCPFFVMELVKGVPLTEFCDAHRLAVPDRLRLCLLNRVGRPAFGGGVGSWPVAPRPGSCRPACRTGCRPPGSPSATRRTARPPPAPGTAACRTGAGRRPAAGPSAAG